jgi:hypothetical protein
VRLELVDGRVVYTLQVGEKATLPATITALGEAGHASVPTLGRNAVPMVAELITRLAAHRTDKRLVPAIRGMVESLGVNPDQELDAVAAQVGLPIRRARDSEPPLGWSLADRHAAAARRQVSGYGGHSHVSH